MSAPPDPGPLVPPRLIVAIAAGAALLVGVLATGWGGERLGVGVSDAASVLTALGATWACGRVAADERRTGRRSWLLLTIACGLWACGEVLWSVWEVVLGIEVPFPSPADVAYLAAVPVAVAALLSFHRRGSARHLARTVLDGCLAGASLLFVAWALVLGPIVRAGDGDVLANGVSLAYPVTDCVLVAVALLVAPSAHPGVRRPLRLLAAALVVMASTDLLFTWTQSSGTFDSSGLLSVGWPLAYALVAMAARAARGGPSPAWDGEVATRSNELAPYAPLAVALGIGLPHVLGGHELGPFLTCDGLVIGLLVLTRQAVTAFDLRTSMAALRERERELSHLALHDALTGLANRAGFDRAFERVTAEGLDTSSAVVFIDLDGFKAVNDALGHETGDEVLRTFAARLRAATPPGAVLARFGGDEFVILVPDGAGDPRTIGEAVLACATTPFDLGGEVAHLGASVGLAVPAGGPGAHHEALRRADAAMYVAKRGGKGRLVEYPDVTLLTAPEEGARPPVVVHLVDR